MPMEESRFVKIETRLDSLENKVELDERRLDTHSDEFEEIYKIIGGLDKDFALLTQKMENTLENTKDIKQEIREIRKIRDDDHLQAPIENVNKFRDQVISFIVSILLAYLIFQLFPMLK